MSILGKLGLKKEKKPEEAKKEDVIAIRQRAEKQSQGNGIAVPRPEAGARKDKGSSRGSAMAHQILLRPVLSEKGTHLAGRGEYVFVVAPGANKSEIRKAIQGVYEVHVRDVKIVKLPGKTRRYGRSAGRTSPRKKAIVKLRAGEKIPGIIEAVG